MSRMKEIIEAASKSGFNLEFKVKKILDKRGYRTIIGKSIKFNESYIEPDIISTQLNDRYLLGECKGSSPESVLILIKEANNENRSFNEQGLIIRNSKNKLVQFSTEGWVVFQTFTGDFYSYKDKKRYEKYSKNDSENNFFKAQSQITEAIFALSSSISSEQNNYITPFIVTNSEIWVVDFNSIPTTATPYKWVLHDTSSNSKLKLDRFETEFYKYSLPIINIQYFDDFVEAHTRFNSDLWQIKLSDGQL